MLDQIASITSGGGRLLRAEGELLLVQARRACYWGGLALLGAAIAALGLLAMLAALTAALAEAIGWAWSIAIAGALLAIVGGGSVLLAKHRLRASTTQRAMPEGIRERAEDARREIAGQSPPGEPTPEHDAEAKSWQDKAVRFALENPGLAAGGAFAVVALVGPWRTLRMLSRGMMLAGLASSLFGGAHETDAPPETDENPDNEPEASYGPGFQADAA